MTFTSNGIEKVRVFKLPVGIWADGKVAGSSQTALVKWHSSLSGMFYQLYVNGCYAGVTVDSQQRQMVVQMPASLERPVQIEVFAVEPEEVNTDFSDKISLSIGQSGRVRIILLRGQNLSIGATVQVYSDWGDGEIDYDKPFNDSPVRVWPVWQDKAGFGMGGFGTSDFGWDCAAAVGFGKGSFGNGQFGIDADTIEWVSRPLQAGVYKFALKITDEAGNESISGETVQVTVIPAARPAGELNVSSFDKQTNQLLLKIV
jgi:hypothetical protein